MNVIIRKLQKEDYKAVAAIWRDVLDIPVTDDELNRTYDKMNGDERYATFVAEADGTVVGLVTMVTALAIGHPNGYTKVNGLGVLKEYRNKGIGKLLMKQAEKEAVANGTRDKRHAGERPGEDGVDPADLHVGEPELLLYGDRQQPEQGPVGLVEEECAAEQREHDPFVFLSHGHYIISE